MSFETNTNSDDGLRVAPWRRLWVSPRRVFEPSDLDEGEEQAFRGEARDLLAQNIPSVVVLLAAALVLWWPFDWIVFADAPELRAIYSWWRGCMVGFLAGGLALVWRTGWLARAPEIVGSVALLTAFCGTAWMLGRVGGLEGPWYYFLLSVPMFTIPLLVRRGPRLLLNALLIVGTTSAFVVARPSALGHPSLIPAVSTFVFTAFFASLLGDLLYHLLRATTTANRRRARSEDELRLLTASLEVRVEQRTAQLRRMLGALEGARAQERQWLAREIHDALGQELTALQYAVRLLRGRATGQLGSAAFGAVEELLQRMSGTTRRLIEGVGAAPADNESLVDALQSLVLSLNTPELESALELDGDLGELSETARLAVYRIAQEATTNVRKHAHARRVLVALEQRAAELLLVVRDDGRGMSASGDTQGMGIRGIRQRAEELGGAAVWASNPGGGTTLQVTIPCPG